MKALHIASGGERMDLGPRRLWGAEPRQGTPFCAGGGGRGRGSGAGRSGGAGGCRRSTRWRLRWARTGGWGRSPGAVPGSGGRAVADDCGVVSAVEVGRRGGGEGGGGGAAAGGGFDAVVDEVTGALAFSAVNLDTRITRLL